MTFLLKQFCHKVNEKTKFDGDVQNTRFNFSPSYVAVDNHFVVSGTLELAKDLIDILKEEKQPKLSPASMPIA